MAKKKKKSTFIQLSRRKSAAEKAAYHNVTGAGKSRVLRKFFELSSSDVIAITGRIDAHLNKAVKEA